MNSTLSGSRLDPEQETKLPTRWRQSPFVIDRNGLLISASQQSPESHPLVVVGNAGFPMSDALRPSQIYYFEVKITQLKGQMAVGLTVRHNEVGYPGWKSGTFALHSSGAYYCGSASSIQGSDKTFAANFGIDDTVGCGWIPSRRRIFYTQNGILLGSTQHVNPEHAGAGVDTMWPVVGFRAVEVVAMANFGVDTQFLWENLDLHGLCSGEALRLLDRILPQSSELSQPPSSRVQTDTIGSEPRNAEAHSKREREGKLLSPTNHLLLRATRRPRRVMMRILRGPHQYFTGTAKELPMPKEDRVSATQVEGETVAALGGSGPISNGNTSPPEPNLFDGAVDLASRLGSTIASLVSKEEDLEGRTFEEMQAAETQAGAERIGELSEELHSMKASLVGMNKLVEENPAEARVLLEELEKNARHIRQRLFIMIICETDDDTTLADLLQLNDQLFGIMEQTQQFSSELPAPAGDGQVSANPSEPSSNGQDLAAGDTTHVDKTANSKVSVPEEAQDPPIVLEGLQKETMGGILNGRSHYGVPEGTADSVRELLYFLRSGNPRAQLNAAITLCYLIREYQHAPEIRNLSRIDAFQGGGISTLAWVLNSHRVRDNPELKYAVSMAIVSIASGSWVEVDLGSFNSSALSSSSSSAEETGTLDPRKVANSFFSELDCVLGACQVLLKDPCYCCEHPSNEAVEFASCRTMCREAILAIANLCLIFHTRDQLFLRADQTEVTTSKSSSTGVGHHGFRQDASASFQKQQEQWTDMFVSKALPLIVQVCKTLSCGFQAEGTAGKVQEEKFAIDEILRFASFSIALLAQYQNTHQSLIDGGIFPVLVYFLKHSDLEVVLHSLTTIYWLTSGAVPPGVADSPSQFHEEQAKASRSKPSLDLVLIGFIVAELITSGALPAIVDLGHRAEALPDSVRYMMAACFASLSTVPPCQKYLCTEHGALSILTLARQILSCQQRQSYNSVEAASSNERKAVDARPAQLTSRCESSNSSSSSSTSSSTSQKAAPLHASNRDIRRRFSSSGRKLSRNYLESTSSVGSDHPKNDCSDTNGSQESITHVEHLEELRYLALALCNFFGSEHSTVVDHLLEAGCGSILRQLISSQDPFVQLHSLRTASRISEKGRDYCDKLEACEISHPVLEILRSIHDFPSKQKLSEIQREIQLHAWLALGNLSEASRWTRVSVAQTEALKFCVQVLFNLYGLEEAVWESRGEGDRGVERDAIEDGELDPIRIILREPHGSDIEVAHQAIRIIAGLVETTSRSYLVPADATTGANAGGSKGSYIGERKDVLSRMYESFKGKVELEEWVNLSKSFLEQSERLLLITILLLGSPASVIQCEACRVLVATTRCPFASSLKFDIARLALRHLVQLAVGLEFPDRLLQVRAEDVLRGLGFTGGNADITLCGRDVEALFTWHMMLQSLEQQYSADALLLAASLGVWRVQLPPPALSTLFYSAFRDTEVLETLALVDEVGADEVLQRTAQESHLPPFPSQLGIESDASHTKLEELSIVNEPLSPHRRAQDSKAPLNALVARTPSFGDLRWLRHLLGCGFRAIIAVESDDEDSIRVFQPGYERPNRQDSLRRHSRSEDPAESAAYLPRLAQEGSERRGLLKFIRSVFNVTGNLQSSPVASWRFSLHQDVTKFCQGFRPGTRGMLGCLFESCKRALEAQVPCMLRIRQFLYPALFTVPQESNTCTWGALIARQPYILNFPHGRDLTARYTRVIRKVLSKVSSGTSGVLNEAELGKRVAGEDLIEEGPFEDLHQSERVWHLSIGDCDGISDGSEFLQHLNDCLDQFPAISSVSFATSRSLKPRSSSSSSLDMPRESVFSAIFQYLPASVSWCIFDGILSESDLVEIVSTMDQKGDQMHVSGLAIRNCGFKFTEMLPFIRLLGPVRTSSEMAIHPSAGGESSRIPLEPPKLQHRLRWIDLSGNMLRDSGCALVLEAVAASHLAGTIEGLDLSRNEIGKYAKETFDALIGEKRKVSLLAGSNNFSELHLGGNGIGSTAASSLLRFLASHPTCSLRVCNLQHNDVADEGFEDALVSFVSSSSSVKELDVSFNNLSMQCGTRVRLALSSSDESRLLFLVLEGNTRIDERDIAGIELVLATHRQEWASQVCQPIFFPSSQAEDHKTSEAQGRDDQEPDKADEFFAEDTSALNPITQDDSLEAIHEGTSVEPNELIFKENTGVMGGSIPSKTSERLDDQSELESEEERPRLSVLFSIPLVGFNRADQLVPIESIDYERELKILLQTFQEASRDIDVSFGFATTDRLRTEVTKQCRAIHYSGHGSPDSLHFENQSGLAQSVPIDNLRRLAGSSSDKEESKVQFVFVSACHSEFAGRAFVEAGVSHVVCVRVGARILDKAAHFFTRHFYFSLALGNTVKQSFLTAKENVDSAPSLARHSSTDGNVGEQFLLLPEGANHDVAIFPNRKQLPSWPPSSSSKYSNILSDRFLAGQRRNTLWRGGHTPPLPEDFIGRRVETFEILQAVRRRKLVCLSGPVGIGKTSVAIAMANYALEREMFGDGILFLRVQDISSVAELVQLLCARTVGDLGDFSSSQGDEFEEAQSERLYEVLRYRQFLLVLDHCDALVASENKFRHFIGRLLDEVKEIRLLLTCTEPPREVPGYFVQNCRLGPLSNLQSTELFLRLCVHNQGRLMVPPKAIPGKYGVVQAMSDDRFFKALRGHPASICNKAFDVSLSEYSNLVEHCRRVASLVVANQSHVTPASLQARPQQAQIHGASPSSASPPPAPDHSGSSPPRRYESRPISLLPQPPNL